jgi:hypothetical protein
LIVNDSNYIFQAGPVGSCTVAHGKNGEIIEEKLFYDKMSLMQQVGLM